VEPDGKERKKDAQDWEELYYGPMVIVEDRVTGKTAAGIEGKYASDRNVEKRMIAFHYCLIGSVECRGDLQTISLQLADACRLSLLQTAQERIDALKSQMPTIKLSVHK
jgi:hypothetical protein